MSQEGSQGRVFVPCGKVGSQCSQSSEHVWDLLVILNHAFQRLLWLGRVWLGYSGNCQEARADPQRAGARTKTPGGCRLLCLASRKKKRLEETFFFVLKNPWSTSASPRNLNKTRTITARGLLSCLRLT